MSRPIVQLLEDVLDNIEDATDSVTDNSEWSDLAQRALVEGHLATAVSCIDEALQRLGEGGIAEMCAELQSLDDIAQRCVELAQEALEVHEIAGGPPAVIGSKLKTLRNLVTGSNGSTSLTRLASERG